MVILLKEILLYMDLNFNKMKLFYYKRANILNAEFFLNYCHLILKCLDTNNANLKIMKKKITLVNKYF